MNERGAHLQALVDRVVREEPVPGAVVGILDGGATMVAAAGTADLGSGRPMTPDTLFLFGSVTKVWVTTLVMTLVDQGILDLDVSLRRYLPRLQLATGEVADQLTLRMLLSHSSGIDAADLIVDAGDDDRAIGRYVALLADRPQLHPPGRFASYNNAGFVLTGGVLEAVTGRSFADIMRERLFEPLALRRTCLATGSTPPDDTAMGHFPTTDGLVRTSRFLLPAALAPAGSTLLVTATDALEFARTHLNGGVTAGRRRLLSPASTAAMQVHQHDWPAPGTGGIALGWWRDVADDGQPILSHGGGSLGGNALLAVLPDRGAAVVAYVNSTASGSALPMLKQQLLAELDVPTTLPGPLAFDPAADPDAFVGTYRRYGMTIDVRRAGHSLELTMHPELEAMVEYLTGQPTVLPCRPVDERCLAVDVGEAASGPPVAWLVAGDAAEAFLYVGGRLARRVG